MALKCLGLTLLYIGVVQGELLGWWDSGLVVSCLIGSAILMGTFIIRAYIYKQSFGANWIKDSNLRLCFIIACLYGFLMLPNSLFIPSFLSVVGGLKPLQIGQVTNLAFFIYLLCSPIAIFLARRLEPRLMMLIGIMIIGGACLIGHQIDYQWRANDFFIVISMQQAMGNVCYLSD